MDLALHVQPPGENVALVPDWDWSLCMGERLTRHVPHACQAQVRDCLQLFKGFHTSIL